MYVYVYMYNIYTYSQTRGKCTCGKSILKIAWLIAQCKGISIVLFLVFSSPLKDQLYELILSLTP